MEYLKIRRTKKQVRAHDSGKTRWLTRLHENGIAIWEAKYKADPLYLDALSPLAAWCDAPALKQ